MYLLVADDNLYDRKAFLKQKLFLFIICKHIAVIGIHGFKPDSFMSNLLCFMLQLIFNFTSLIRASRPLSCHSRENFVFDSRLRVL